MVTYCIRRFLMSARLLLPTAGRQSHAPPAPARSQSTQSTSQTTGAYRLDGRGVVRVAGRDTVDLLQGLVTSDVTDMIDVPAQYSMMLNVQGRVLYDLILYNQTVPLESVCFLVECDATLKDDFIKAVQRYRIRKKVDISDVSDEYSVWSLPSDLDPTKLMTNLLEGRDDETSQIRAVEVENAVFCVPDPRVPLFGQRLIFKNGEEAVVNMSKDSARYESLRYSWGIPEGARDLPPGNCLPLESNLTIMNGVSFLKGCYVGQELTARTHHTGVIRKRLMPLLFDNPPASVDSDAKISTDKGKNAGKLRAFAGNHGLGLVRLEHHDKPLSVSNTASSKLSLAAYIPGWWPQELQK